MCSDKALGSTTLQGLFIRMAEEPVAKRKKLDDAAALSEGVDANEVIKFRLLHTSSNGVELTDEASFGPDMAHQFFGDDEVWRHAWALIADPKCNANQRTPSL